jgi:hypothetical protein
MIKFCAICEDLMSDVSEKLYQHYILPQAKLTAQRSNPKIDTAQTHRKK